jgi:HD-GYP domain-containing protein (c-di-GMP phosphodiesterase class II)
VAAIGLEIAAAMDLPADELIALRRSGLLHDIGKLGVEDHILRKPGPLNDQEWESIRRHPVIGYDMLKDVPFLAPSLAGVRHHHERWDGDGYPDRLEGEAIPLAVRILCVADAFDAITSDRPYRTSFSFQFALQTILQGAGSQFDPAVVKAFQSRADRIIALLKGMGKAPAPHAADIHLERTA